MSSCSITSSPARPFTVLALVLLLGATASLARAQAPAPATASVTFEQARAVLRKRCYTCHGQGELRGDFSVASLESIRAGSASGPVLVPGDPEKSLIYTLTAHLETPRMPPGGKKIPASEIELLRAWIQGLSDAPAPAPMPSPIAAAAAPVMPAASAAPVPLWTAASPALRPTAATALAVSPDGSLVSVAGLKQVLLYASGDPAPKALPFPAGEVHRLQISADGRRLLVAGGTGAQEGRLRIYDVAQGLLLHELADETDALLAADLSPDGALVAYGGPARTVTIQRVADGQVVAELKKHTDWILAVRFSPDGLLLASSDRFGAIQLWEAETGRPFATFRGHVGAVTALEFSASGDRLHSAGVDGFIRRWNLHEAVEESKFDAALGPLLALGLDAEGRLYVGSRKKLVASFAADGARRWQTTLPDEVNELALTRSGDRLVAADAGGLLHLIDGSTGSVSGRLVLPVVAASAPLAAVPRRIRPEPAAPPPTPAELAAALAAEELALAVEAQRLADEAVAAAEDSLAKLKLTAAQMKRLTAAREAALRAAEAAAGDKP